MDNSINICKKVANISTEFEKNNSDLKRRFLIRNIDLYNQIVGMVDGNRGSFGTGYPFYSLNRDLKGKLPIIEEQLRYNYELIYHVDESEHTVWPCVECLSKNNDIFPDLKSICKPCPHIEKELKPRKIINRLPDIDMWMVCKDGYIDVAKEELSMLFHQYNIYPSDINPIQTIDDMDQIVQSLQKGTMPEKSLPLDSHIIGYSALYSLIEQVPIVLKQAYDEGKAPFLPIRPLSYRKVWQYDDEAYNFIYDYFSAFTEFNFEESLQQTLNETRNIIANSYSFDQLFNFLVASAQKSNKRRFKSLELKNRFRERIETWKN